MIVMLLMPITLLVDMLAAKVQMLEQIATDAVAAGRESNAIDAIRLLNELVGFGAG